LCRHTEPQQTAPRGSAVSQSRRPPDPTSAPRGSCILASPVVASFLDPITLKALRQPCAREKGPLAFELPPVAE
jgi:hypothetical protein